MKTRRAFLAATSATIGTAVVANPFVSRPVRAADKMIFMTPSSVSSDFIDVQNAVSGGHWTRQGIDGSVVGAPGTAVALTQVISGQAHFGYCSGIDYIRVVATKSAPLMAVGAIGQTSFFYMISLKDHPVLKPEDLAGKVVGILSLGGTTETYIDVMAASAGLKKGDVQVVAAGNSPGEVELIKQKRIDCFLATFSVVHFLRRTGAPVEIWNLDRFVPAPSVTFWTRRDIVSERPDYVRRVMQGIKASVDEIIAGPIEPILERASKDFEIPGIRDIKALADLERGMVQEIWLAKGRQNLLRNDAGAYQTAAEFFRTLKIADIKDPAALYTNRFVDAL
jgi:ABC-type nitrate/sulfonate/bicarbonate transport system substrate-binding protein